MATLYNATALPTTRTTEPTAIATLIYARYYRTSPAPTDKKCRSVVTPFGTSRFNPEPLCASACRNTSRGVPWRGTTVAQPHLREDPHRRRFYPRRAPDRRWNHRDRRRDCRAR